MGRPGISFGSVLTIAARTVGVLTAIVLTYVAQGWFAGTIRRPVPPEHLDDLGGLAFILSGLLFGCAMSWGPLRFASPRVDREFRIFRPQLFAIAVAAYFTSLGLYLIGGESPAVLLAWGGATAGLLAACWYPSDRDDVARSREWADWLLPLTLILSVALVLRLWRLDALPQELVGDTMTDGLATRTLLYGSNRGIIGFDPEWGLLTRTEFLPEMASMLVFGNTLFGLSMSSVVMGMLSLVATYLLGAELYNRRVGWLATGVLAVSYTHIHFSRVPHVIDAVPWAALSLYFLVRATRTAMSWDAVLGGLTTGFACQTYYAGRTALVVAALLGGYLVVRRRPSLRLWLFAACGFLVSFGAVALFLIQNRGRYLSRPKDVSILFNADLMAHLQASYGDVSRAAVIWENSKRAFLTFFYYENTCGARDLGRPFFDRVTAPLLPLGFGFAVLRPIVMANWLVTTGFFATVFLTAFASDSPSWQRMVTAMPFAAILIALPLDRILIVTRVEKRLAMAVLLAALAVVGWRNWTYFVAHESTRVDTLSLAARYAATVPMGHSLVLVEPPLHHQFVEFRFMASHVETQTVLVQDALAGQWPALRATPVVLFAADHSDLLPIVQAAWPGGEVRQLKLPDGRLAFYAYEARSLMRPR